MSALRPRLFRFCFALGLGLALSGALNARPAAAHQRSLSNSFWEVKDETVTVTVRLPSLELSRFGPDGSNPAWVAGYVADRIAPWAGALPCPPEALPTLLRRTAEAQVWILRFRCPRGAALRARSTLLMDVAPGHLHLATGLGPPGAVSVLTADAPEGPSEGSHALTNAPPSFWRLGMAHLITGADHLAFLLGMLLLSPGLARLARAVTGFTVGHSLTLALAVTGVLTPPVADVEALIALSIVLLAVEIAHSGPAQRKYRLAWVSLLVFVPPLSGIVHPSPLALAGLGLFALAHGELSDPGGAAPRGPGAGFWAAAAFGSIHGLGFASALDPLELTPGTLARDLLAFNLGLEAGQLLVVLPLAALFAWLRPLRAGAAILGATHAAIAGVGIYWFVNRIA